jgi:hypothetical protein
MNPEEIAVLRILYKHYHPINLSTLIEGFPDDSKSLIFDAVSRLQLLSYLNMTECSSVLYVAINRQMRRDVFNLLEDASEQYNANKRKENEILLKPPIQAKHVKPLSECSYKSDMDIQGNRELLLRIPKRAIKLTASMLVFSFFILGTISARHSRSQISRRLPLKYRGERPYLLNNFTILSRARHIQVNRLSMRGSLLRLH